MLVARDGFQFLETNRDVSMRFESRPDTSAQEIGVRWKAADTQSASSLGMGRIALRTGTKPHVVGMRLGLIGFSGVFSEGFVFSGG